MASDTPAGQPATLPAAAVQAAIEAVMARRNLVSDESRKWARPIVVDALEAAAPHLAAAERERCMLLTVERVNELEQLARDMLAHFRGGNARGGNALGDLQADWWQAVLDGGQR